MGNGGRGSTSTVNTNRRGNGNGNGSTIRSNRSTGGNNRMEPGRLSFNTNQQQFPNQQYNKNGVNMSTNMMNMTPPVVYNLTGNDH